MRTPKILQSGMTGGQNVAMARNDQTIDRRPCTAEDFDFAWGLYRCSMKPLAEQIMAWQEERQKAVVERAVASGQASIIVAGGRQVGWLHVRDAGGFFPDAHRAVAQLDDREGARCRKVGMLTKPEPGGRLAAGSYGNQP